MSVRYMQAAWFDRAPSDRRQVPADDPDALPPRSSYDQVIVPEPIRLGKRSDYETVTREQWEREA